MMLHEPITLQAGIRTVGHFQRKDESAIYLVYMVCRVWEGAGTMDS